MTVSLQPERPALEPMAAREKEQKLRALMREMRSMLVAYSGGVDSAYLAYVATSELREKALCVLGISPSVSTAQRDEAEQIARDFGFRFETIETDEFENPEYIANPNNRCYFCKSELFGKLAAMAEQKGIACVVDGTNADDIGGHRPGMLAADEKGVRSLLVEAGLTKAEIRELSHEHGLPSWDKPASPCLSSRVAYGVPVTIERLSRIERGEAILRDLGFREFRLREHQEIARIEIAPAEFGRILDLATIDRIANSIRNLGFKYVTLDLHGYRSGALNEKLPIARNNE
jgi:uncharacterized protein